MNKQKIMKKAIVECSICGKRIRFLSYDTMDVPLYLLGLNTDKVCEKCEYGENVPKRRYIEKLEYLLHNITSKNCYFEREEWDGNEDFRRKVFCLIGEWSKKMSVEEYNNIKKWVAICDNRNYTRVGFFSRYVGYGEIAVEDGGDI